MEERLRHISPRQLSSQADYTLPALRCLRSHHPTFLFLLPLLHSISPLLYPPQPYLKCFHSTGHRLTRRPVTPWAMALGVFSPIRVSRPLIAVRIYLVCLDLPAHLPHRNLDPDRPPLSSGLPHVHVYHVCLARLCLGCHTALHTALHCWDVHNNGSESDRNVFSE